LQHVEQALGQQRVTVEALKAMYRPPALPLPPSRNGPTAPADWHEAALDFLDRHRQSNPTRDCPLPELFDELTRSRKLSIGEFHDGLRELARKGAIDLKPFTRPGHELKRGELALVADQEIKFYAQRSRDSR
jgi:hypothetical protein